MDFKVLKFQKRKYVYGYLFRGYQFYLPRSLNIEPTNICNLACPICPNGMQKQTINVSDNRPKGLMSIENFQRIIEQVDIPISTINLYLHGEPFLNQQLADMIKIAFNNNIKCIISSNGYNIPTDALERVIATKPHRIIYSMDLVEKEEFELLRYPASFDQARKNLLSIDEHFTKLKSTYDLKIIFLRLKNDALEDFINYIGNLKSVNRLLLSHPFPWPYTIDDKVFKNRIIKGYVTCPQIWSSPNIFWNGDVSVCSFDFNGELVVNNILNNKLSRIINSTAYRMVRINHLIGKKGVLNICSRCMIPKFKMDQFEIRVRNFKSLKLNEKLATLRTIIQKLAEY